jgi:hypothetical protein
MFNKILIFWGATLILIIIFTNMVSVMVPVNFLWITTSVWMLSLISAIIWIWIWIWLKGFLSESWDDDNYDF